MNTVTPIEKAVRVLGTQQKLADRLKVSTQAISKWRRTGRVPAERVLEVEKATGGEVSRSELRPDLYPIETVA